jgi:hypothetical protein
MKRLLALLLLSAPAFAVTLNTPYFVPTQGTQYLGPKYTYGTGTYNPGRHVSVAGNQGGAQQLIDWFNTQGATYCLTEGVTLPTAPIPGTCGAGSTSITTGTDIDGGILGKVQLNLLATKAGNTNSAVNTITMTIQPFFPVPISSFAWNPAPIISGLQGQVNIVTTDGSAPSITGSCTPAGTSISVTNNTAISALSSGTTVVKAAPCTGSTLGAAQSATYSVVAKRTWYIRTGGGTRFSTNVAGQCDGLADVDYPGSGTNQHCAFNDVRYLWDDDSGAVSGIGSFIISGGDDIIIRGCTANAHQQQPANPTCRIGWDINTGGGANNLWCPNAGNTDCTNPTIPSGGSSNPTRFLGQNFATCNTGGATNPKAYVANLSQLFGGMGIRYTLDLRGAANIVFQCFELTSHNFAGANSPTQCTRNVSPGYPGPCATSAPVDDFADNGFRSDNTTGNITFTDVYVHGFSASGMIGAMGGVVSMTRVNFSTNGFSAWNMDNDGTEPDEPSSQFLVNFATLIGNGCFEEYPLVHTLPWFACYDDVHGGFGDTWSGQDTNIDTISYQNSTAMYNTKDAFVGPHPNAKHLIIKNNTHAFNMGSNWKFILQNNADAVIQNNHTLNGCGRMALAVTGASQSFALSTGNPGAFLSDFCRAGGNSIASNVQQNDTVNLNGNTWQNYESDTDFEWGCGTAFNNNAGNCGTSVINETDGIHIGWLFSGQPNPPAIFSADDVTVTYNPSHNDTFGNKTSTGQNCGTSGNICVDAQLINEIAQCGGGGCSNLAAWDYLLTLTNWNPCPSAISGCTGASPAIGAGIAVTGMTTDFNGVTRPNPPTIGANEPTGAPTVTTITVLPNPAAVTVGDTVNMATASFCTFSDSSTIPAGSAGCVVVWTDTGAHSSINSSTGVVTGASVGSDTVTATLSPATPGTATVNVSAAAGTTIRSITIIGAGDVIK